MTNNEISILFGVVTIIFVVVASKYTIESVKHFIVILRAESIRSHMKIINALYQVSNVADIDNPDESLKNLESALRAAVERLPLTLTFSLISSMLLIGEIIFFSNLLFG